VREIVPEGWRLTGLVCSGNSTVNLSTATATITVAAGERVSCTFTDEKLGRIEIVKAIRGETTTTFTFGAPTTLVPTGVFTLTPTVAAGSATRVFTNVPTGSYFITENGPPGSFRLLSIDCVDPTGDTRTSPADGGASIQLAAGESVTCTYTNATLATITLGTISAFGQAQFGYSLTNFQTANSATITTVPVTESLSGGRVTYGNLPPAVYTITAQPAPAGWQFQYAQCTSSSGEQKWIISGLTITILLPDGETVNCNYVYAPLPVTSIEPIGVPVHTPLMALLLALSLLAGGGFLLRRR
jgi:hypothetical protein